MHGQTRTGRDRHGRTWTGRDRHGRVDGDGSTEIRQAGSLSSQCVAAMPSGGEMRRREVDLRLSFRRKSWYNAAMKTLLCGLVCAVYASLAAGVRAADYAEVLAAGNVKDCVSLGRQFYKGDGALLDFEKAARLFHTAAIGGNAEAQYMMAVMYSEGAGLRERPEKAFAWATAAAQQGHADAANLLGVFYTEGYGVERNDALAADWFEKSAAAGNAKGAFNLATSFEYGTGVKKDLTQAVIWYQRSAEKGNVIAQYSLGTCYEYGMGVTRNPGLAVQWYSRAAEQGDSRGQLALGFCYERGVGVLRNPAMAAAWYSKAAELGNDAARMRLAQCYEKGVGVAADAKRAVVLYQQASEAGHPPAMLAYGLALEFGRGVREDLDAARDVYQKAVEADLDEARQRLRYLDWDEAAANARADAMKDRTLVFKGLYLGMPVEDAAITLERQLRAAGVAEPLYIEQEQGVPVVRRGVDIGIDGDAEGCVTRIYLANSVVDLFFDTASLSNAEFITTFIQAYGDSAVVRSSEYEPIFIDGQSVGSQKRHVFRYPVGYALIFYDAYAFNVSGAPCDALAVGACKPMGSFALQRVDSDEERAAKFD